MNISGNVIDVPSVLECKAEIAKYIFKADFFSGISTIS